MKLFIKHHSDFDFENYFFWKALTPLAFCSWGEWRKVKVNLLDVCENEENKWNLLQLCPGRTGKTPGKHGGSLWSWSVCTGLCKGSTAVGNRRPRNEVKTKKTPSFLCSISRNSAVLGWNLPLLLRELPWQWGEKGKRSTERSNPPWRQLIPHLGVEWEAFRR